MDVNTYESNRVFFDTSCSCFNFLSFIRFFSVFLLLILYEIGLSFTFSRLFMVIALTTFVFVVLIIFIVVIIINKLLLTRCGLGSRLTQKFSTHLCSKHLFFTLEIFFFTMDHLPSFLIDRHVLESIFKVFIFVISDQHKIGL
jgi:hypothetical protein